METIKNNKERHNQTREDVETQFCEDVSMIVSSVKTISAAVDGNINAVRRSDADVKRAIERFDKLVAG
jgi:hypothetical protein